MTILLVFIIGGGVWIYESDKAERMSDAQKQQKTLLEAKEKVDQMLKDANRS